MTDLDGLRRDLADEQQALDTIVATLDDAQWAVATPSPGWTVADQIGHLAYFDRAAATAITDPEAFAASVEVLLAAAADPAPTSSPWGRSGAWHRPSSWPPGATGEPCWPRRRPAWPTATGLPGTGRQWEPSRS